MRSMHDERIHYVLAFFQYKYSRLTRWMHLRRCGEQKLREGPRTSRRGIADAGSGGCQQAAHQDIVGLAGLLGIDAQ